MYSNIDMCIRNVGISKHYETIQIQYLHFKYIHVWQATLLFLPQKKISYKLNQISYIGYDIYIIRYLN